MRRDGNLLDQAAFMSAMGMTARSLQRAPAAGQAFAVDVEGTNYYPAFYADGRYRRRHLYAVSRRMSDLSGGARFQFFVTKKGSLNRVTPLTALAEGQVVQVLAAARAFMQW